MPGTGLKQNMLDLALVGMMILFIKLLLKS